jgi:copper chaperone CopZ
MTHKYQIKGMHCSSCVTKIQEALARLPHVQSAIVSLNPPEATVTMREHISTEELNQAAKKAGDYSLQDVSEKAAPMPAPESARTSYLPLILVFAYLIGVILLRQFHAGVWDWKEAMNDFMGGFFLVFSFFKLLNLRGFVASYLSYDVITKKWMTYGYIYPFLELALGIAYVVRFNPLITNWATLILMTVSSIGVVQSLLNKRKIQCACLGAVFNLPMSKVTLIEDVLMAGMALTMIFLTHG